MAAPAVVPSDSTNLIATSVELCARGFVSLAESLTPETRFSTQVSALKVRDEFDRFKLWAGNIAAHRKGRRSLEYRLRDAAHLKTETLRLLESLTSALRDGLDIVSEKKIPWDEIEYSDSDSDSASSDDGHTATSLQGSTELKQLFTSAQTVVKALFRLSMAIRDPAPNNQSTSTINIDKTFFEQHDIMHVKAKFPDAAEYLSERLGRAISGRRQYLSYREEHHQKLTKHVEKIGFERPMTEFTTNSTEATPIPGIERSNSLNVLDDGEDSLSQTSYATSVNAAIRVPPLPKEAKEREFFECPLCFMIVSIKTTVAWKQHVYRDLHPYCCTFEDCTTADRLYDSRHAWFAHENEAHRTSWLCVDGCAKVFVHLLEFQKHIQTQHAELKDIFPALKRTSAKRTTLTEQVYCQLCNARMSLRALQRHMGKHQQQLALFALPPSLDDTEDDPDGEDDSIRVDESDNTLSDLEDTTRPTESDGKPTSNSERGDESEDDEDRRCTCGRPSDGNMIMCDSRACAHRWYHWECVGLDYDTIPEGKWFCSDQCHEAYKKRLAMTPEVSREGEVEDAPPAVLNSDAQSRLMEIEKEFERTCMPMWLDFITYPPGDEKERNLSLLRMKELVMQNIVAPCEELLTQQGFYSSMPTRRVLNKALNLIARMENLAGKQADAANKLPMSEDRVAETRESMDQLPRDGEGKERPDIALSNEPSKAVGSSNHQPDADYRRPWSILSEARGAEDELSTNRLPLSEAMQESADGNANTTGVLGDSSGRDDRDDLGGYGHFNANDLLEALRVRNESQSGDRLPSSQETNSSATAEYTMQEGEGHQRATRVEESDGSESVIHELQAEARKNQPAVQDENYPEQPFAASASQSDSREEDVHTQNQSSRDNEAEKKEAQVEGAASSSFHRPVSPSEQDRPQKEAKGSKLPHDPNSQPYRPTYPKIHSTYLDVDTLHYYDIPFILDPQDHKYFLLQKEMSVEETDVLFEHTRRLRDKNRRRIFESEPNENASSKSTPRRRGSDPNVAARESEQPIAEDHDHSLFERPERPATYRPTYVKISKEHIEVETLQYYDLPFREDDQDPNYFIIYQELTNEQTAVLFKHTRQIRSRSEREAPSGSDK